MMESFELVLDDNLVIRGNVHVAETFEKQPVLLFCHGFKGFKDWGSFPYAAEQFAKRGIATIRFNFSCNGVGASLTEFDELEKFGVNTFAREIADLRALVAAIESGDVPFASRFDLDNLFLLGHSKGGGDAILFGANHPKVKGIITWNGISNVNLFDENLRKQIAENGVGYILNGRTGQNMPITDVVIKDVDEHKQEYDLLAKAAGMKQLHLIVQGDQDFPRLVAGAKAMKEASPQAELHWIIGGDHTWNTKHPFAGTTDALEEAIEVSANYIRKHSSR